MIIVTGLPRSGTSMTMQVLAAGGLYALIGRDGKTGRPGNRHGVWELRGGNQGHVIRASQSDPNSCVKVLYRQLQRVLIDGVRPAAVIVTDRPLDKVETSRATLFHQSPTADEMAAVRDATLALLDDARVPRYALSTPALVTDTRATVTALAAFLAPYVTVGLSIDAMAAVPDPADFHL